MTNFKHFKIIAICGFKGSGKDFVANYISQVYNYEHLKISSKLKEATKLLFDMNDEQIEGDKKELIDERWNVTPRQVMQFIGTEIFQYKIQDLVPECNRDFWIKSFVNTLNTQKKGNVVISDMRFLHEYNYLRKYMPVHDLVVIRIDNVVDSMYDVEDVHVSETEYKKIPIDFQINNDMTSDIKTTIETIMNSITY